MSLYKRTLFFVGLFLLLASGTTVWAGEVIPTALLPKDSIGAEVRNGKTFILYQVDPKETLYGIANKYNISVAELVKHNPSTETGLKVGDILAIPYTPAYSCIGHHVVGKSETLFSISRQYNVSVEELRSWNKLDSDAISIGDRLRVTAPTSEATGEQLRTTQPAGTSPNYAGKIVHSVKEKETLYTLARMYDTKVEKIKEWNKLSGNSISVGQKLIVGTANTVQRNDGRTFRQGATTQEDRKRDYAYNTDPMAISQIGDPTQTDLQGAAPDLDGSMVRKITELGMAQGISDSLNTKKYLALHRTAPIGTIMQVHNEMNNLSVFVRVVGKLPETADNDKTIIKLSEKAFHKLGAYGEKFPVRLSYIP